MSHDSSLLQSHYLIVSLGAHYYAVPIRAVLEMRAASSGEPLTGVPDYVSGALARADDHLAILDLRRRLQWPARDPATQAVMVIVATTERTLGIVVDAVADVVDLHVRDGVGTPRAAHDTRADLAYLKGAATAGERMVLMLDLEQLIPADDAPAVDAAVQGLGRCRAA